MRALTLTLTFASLLCACQPSGMPKGPNTFACPTILQGRTSVCLEFSVPSAQSEADGKRACLIDTEQTVAPECSKEGLLGCCSHKRPDGSSEETCYYKNGIYIDDAQKCAAENGGVWSSAP